MTATAKPAKTVNCDVVILGSGIAGSTLAAILAKAGVSVVLVDAASHPRFAVGESTIPPLMAWLKLLAVRYQVPEIHALTSVDKSTELIGNSFGVKRHFGFMLHRPGEEPDPREANQYVIPDMLTSASHLFRQDCDYYMFQVAAQYGCQTRQNWRAVDVDLDDDGVTVVGHTGEILRGRYLVDASGFRSPLADKLALREQPARFKHHSRSLFTHMVGVKPFDDVSRHPADERPKARWHEGTMHHLFERGWFWIIPFDNYKPSRNRLCSVGLTMDERLYPKNPDLTPEEEFHEFLKQYPAVARQFEGAAKVREWVSTDRLQYSSRQTIGPRWCLMSHAAGFIDPLFSRGLCNTFEVLNSLAWRLIAACGDDDFSEERFKYVEKLEQGLLDYNDDLVNCSFISFSHFRLWDAVFRVWGLITTPNTMRITTALGHYNLHDRDESYLQKLEDSPYTGMFWPDSPHLQKILDVMVEVCEKYEIGEVSGDEAADQLFAAVVASPVTTPFGWTDPNRRFIYPGPRDMIKYLRWAATSDVPELRTLGRETVRGMVTSALKRKKFL
ncbi:MAG: NAD(P)-binding protein [Catenulispora sp.]|nr:NAD(P)-binding protein [Catenulispora sp.]